MVFGTIIRAIIQHFSTQNIHPEENAKVDWFAIAGKPNPDGCAC
jgi:hypothetical protein